MESPPVLHGAGQQAAVLGLKARRSASEWTRIPHGPPGAHTLGTMVASVERNRAPGDRAAVYVMGRDDPGPSASGERVCKYSACRR